MWLWLSILRLSFALFFICSISLSSLLKWLVSVLSWFFKLFVGTTFVFLTSFLIFVFWFIWRPLPIMQPLLVVLLLCFFDNLCMQCSAFHCKYAQQNSFWLQSLMWLCPPQCELFCALSQFAAMGPRAWHLDHCNIFGGCFDGSHLNFYTQNITLFINALLLSFHFCRGLLPVLFLDLLRCFNSKFFFGFSSLIS